MSRGTQRTLVLVRHAESEPRRDLPASRWTLSARGRAQAADVAARIRAHSPAACVSSPEPKAVETARLVAGPLGLIPRTVRGLAEHARESVPFFPDPGDFRAAVLDMLARPGEPVFGEETASESLARFSTALEGVMADEPGNVVAVTHGTVMSLWLSPVLELPASEIWTSLGFCGTAVLRWPSRRLVERFAGA